MTHCVQIRRFCLTTLFASLMMSGIAVRAKEWKSITIATEGSYEPWNLTLPGGSLYSIDATESKLSRQVRRVLLDTHNVNEAFLKAVGYWRAEGSEDD